MADKSATAVRAVAFQTGLVDRLVRRSAWMFEGGPPSGRSGAFEAYCEAMSVVLNTTRGTIMAALLEAAGEVGELKGSDRPTWVDHFTTAANRRLEGGPRE